jgi:hypothetical protein
LSCYGFSTADEGRYAPAHTAEERANGHHFSTKPSPANVSYLVQSNTFTDRVTAESVGTAYPAIAEGRLGSFYVPIPPIPEQTAIAEYVNAQTAKLDTAIAAARGDTLGLTEGELAFYDALETNDSTVKVLGEPTLKQIAQELVETVRRNVTIDWAERENVRANLRRNVKRVLRKYGYPPDKQEKATDTVLEQAEVLSEQWARSA